MRKHVEAEVIEGTFKHVIFAPHGDIEGLIIESDDGRAQVVIPREADHEKLLRALSEGAMLRLHATFSGWSSSKKDAHRVYELVALLTVDGKKPKAGRSAARRAPYHGTIVRLNYARHGEPNGYFLDTGDFIHTKPEGFKRLNLQVGAVVEADGDAYPLDAERGYVVEAKRVNGKNIH